MKYIYRIASIAVFLCISFLFTSKVYAQTSFVIGGGPRQLKVTLYGDVLGTHSVSLNGCFYVERETAPGNGVFAKQFYCNYTPIFAIQIGAVLYTSSPSYWAYAADLGIILNTSPNAVDVANVVGTRGEYSKTFTGTYNGNSFSVTTTFIYDTSNPDYFVISSKVDARNITGNPSISLAYGYDAYVNNNDVGVAWILPDPSGYNGGAAQYLNFTQAQVRALQLVGSTNATNSGSFMGFFPMGQAFDRAYSAGESGLMGYYHAYSYRILGQTNPTYINRFQFGPTTGGYDNGVGVGFYDIPSGVITTINTGLTFTNSLDGTLDYLWNGVKDGIATIGSAATLNLIYESFSPTPLSGVGFRANFPGLSISSSCNMSPSGWAGAGISDCANGNNYYKLSGASVAAVATGNVDVPITVMQYGQWVVSASSISETARTLPTGTPATLTASTRVNISNISSTSICAGTSSIVTVKLDGTATTSQDITVGIDYTGSTIVPGDYSSLPTTVTIPANSNSATFTITTTNTAVNGHTFNIRLTDTDKAFATIGAAKTGTITIKGQPTLSSSLTPTAVCSGSAFSYTATCGLPGTTTYSWTRAAISGINGGAAGSGSDGNISEVLTSTGTTAVNVTYAIMLTNNGCSNTQNVVVSVKSAPTLTSLTSLPAICSGGTVSYTAISSIGGASISWTRAAISGINGNVAGSGSSATISEVLTNSSTNPITVTYAYTLTASDCSTTQNVTVVVNPTATATNITASNVTICNGATATLSATASGVTSPVFTWYADNTTPTALATGASYTTSALTTGSYIYYVSVAGTGVCENAAGSRKAVVVTVNRNATAADITANNAVMCSGATVTLSATASGITSPVFTWYADNTTPTALSTGASYTTPILTTGTYTYYVSVSGTGVCENATGSRKAVTVTVKRNATAADITASNATICSGATATLSATAGSITSPVFTWYPDNVTSTSLATGASYTTSTLTPGTYTYYVGVSGTDVCENVMGSRKAVTVTVNRTATAADITASNVTICSGSTATLSATSGIASPVFTWYVDNVTTTALATGASYTTPALTTGSYTYYVSVSGTSVCENVASSRKAVTVTVNRNATAADVTASNATICSGSTATLSATSGVTSPVFTWYADNVTTTALATGASYTTSTLTTGTYTYYISVSGTGVCENVASSRKAVTVTVNPPAALAHTSGSTAQTVNQNSAITGIVYTYSGSATGGTVSGLPAGVTASVNTVAKTITISGTPTAAGTFSYTVTATGASSPCPDPTLSGTITVNGLGSLTLTSAAGTNAQTICRGSAITTITYSYGGACTNATVTGLPTGVTANVNTTTKVIAISGTPSVTTSGLYTYTVTATGAAAGDVVATGSITVNLPVSLTLTSAASTTAQTVTQGNAITGITYSYANATGATVTSLPAGVTYTATGGVVTISGAPTVTGVYTYTVITTGASAPCTNATLTGTITSLPCIMLVKNSNLVENQGGSPTPITVAFNDPTFTWTSGVTVTLSNSGGNGTYYTAPTSVTISAGYNSADVTIVPIDNNTLDGDQLITFTISSPSGSFTLCSGSNSQQVTITDDENIATNKQVSVALVGAGTTVNEGSQRTVRVSLPIVQGAAVAVPLTITGSATYSTDYTLTPGAAGSPLAMTVSIPAGQTYVDITLDALADNLLEGNETVIFTGGTLPSGYTYASQSATVTIVDRTDGAIIVEKYRPLPISTDASEPSTNGSFRIRFANSSITSTTATKVGIAVSAASTAVSGVDYEPIGVTYVTIPMFTNEIELPITVKNNNIVQGKRTLVLTITSIIP